MGSWIRVVAVVVLGTVGFVSCDSGGELDLDAGGSDGSGASNADGDGGIGGSGGASADGGSSSSLGGGGSDNGVGGTPLGQGGEEGNPETECNDGIDNDDDGQTDYALDPGCYGPGDATEAAGPRTEENGLTTFEFGDDSVVVYVSSSGGDDAASGSTPETAVQTLARANELVRNGQHDFMLLRRGDTWRDETLGRFKSGLDAQHPLVVGSYGASTELPRLEIGSNFIDHDGQTGSYLALVDLHLIAYGKDPTDADYDGATDASVRFVGNGSNLLIEGCHFEYVELIIQSYGPNDEKYESVELRASVIEKAYHVDTCVPGDPNGNPDIRPSGLYASHVDGLRIEGNVFDHNGWNEDVESACATIYNHNTYLNANDLVITGNVFSRASSMHVKLRSDETGDLDGLTISNNYFVEGEIGVSIGGNSAEPFRFVDGVISENVFSDIGRSQPTTRTLAWGVEVADNDGLVIEQNHFLNQWQPGVDNSYGIALNGGTNRDVLVSENLFYRIQGRALVGNSAAGAHEEISVTGNTFIDPDQDAVLTEQTGSFAGYSYSSNQYFGSAPAAERFEIESGTVDFAGWVTASGETGAVELPALPNFVDPDRTIESYAASLGIGEDLEAYLAEARLQTRLRWHRELSAPAINQYIRDGFAE